MSDHYDREQNRVIGQVASAAFSDATGSIIDTHSAVKVLAITVTAEIVALAMCQIAKDKVLEFIQEEGINVLFYGGAFFFFNGFFIAFAIYRLAANKWPHRGVRVLIWLVSIVAGTINVLIAFAMLALEWR
jgi:hypothetical protein